MSLFRDLGRKDKDAFLSMVRDFYASSAVVGDVDHKNFENTFDAAMERSPFIRVLIAENEGKPMGYALLSFTYSNEVGGMVVLIEELYIYDAFRGAGYGNGFFQFLEQEYPLAKRFRLEVRKDNQDAIRLYERLGYRRLDYEQMIKDI